MKVLVLLAVFVSLAVSSCASPTLAENEELYRTKLARQVNDELEVGRQISARLLGSFGVYSKDAQLTEYLNLVGQGIASEVGRTELKFHFSILNSEEINAFAAPGGYVFVTKGLLAIVHSESELACVLGHEIAHVNEKHMFKELQPKSKQGDSESGEGDMLVNLLSRGSAHLGLAVTQMVNGGLKLLLEQGFGKDREYAADQLGVSYVTSVGYDGGALLEVLKRIDQSRGTVKISKTHPPYPERIQSLATFLKANGIKRSIASQADQVFKVRFDRAVHVKVDQGT